LLLEAEVAVQASVGTFVVVTVLQIVLVQLLDAVAAASVQDETPVAAGAVSVQVVVVQFGAVAAVVPTVQD
jgi:hypothetical protein